MNLPNAVTGVFQGMLLFFLLATDVFVKYRIIFGSPKIIQHPFNSFDVKGAE
jgi:simple sugar transport system permease protein